MKKRKKRRASSGRTGLICGLLFSLCAGTVYFFSEDSRIQALACSGNYYFTSQEIYALAGVSRNTRMLFNPTSEMENRLEENPFIESASVSLEGKTISIDVSEKTIVGYYADKEGTRFLLSDGSSLPIEEQSEIRKMIHVPMLVDLTEDQRSQLASQVSQYPAQITKEVLEKIAEIVPWQESYDDQMLKLTMQDGNEVFTSLASLPMIGGYQDILSGLQGETACLLLDAGNSVIDQIACSDMYLSSEEKDARRARQLEEQAKAEQEQKKKEQEEKEKEKDKEEDSEKKNETDPDAPSQESGSEEEKQPEEEQPESQRVEADDWQESDYSWLYYSPSTGVYRSKYADVQYIYDETMGMFSELK